MELGGLVRFLDDGREIGMGRGVQWTVIVKYELFISYTRKDNELRKPDDEKGWVTALRDEIISDHRRFSTETLSIFFDTEAIHGMDDWRHRILDGLRQARILIVCLSPDYFRSKYCRMEWEEYLNRQVHALPGHDSVAPVYFVQVPGSGERESKETFADWLKDIQPWVDSVMRANFIDLRPWFPNGIQALREAAVREKIETLGTSLWERLRRVRRASIMPGNVRRLNPHFVGRSAELRELHESLALGAIGVVTAVHGLGGQGKTELVTAYAHAQADCYPAGIWMLSAENRKSLLPLLGELAVELGIALATTTDAQCDSAGRDVLRELKQRVLNLRAQDSDKRAACLVILDNVSEPELLSLSQLMELPREDWLCVLITTREGEDRFPTIRKDRSGRPMSKQDLLVSVQMKSMRVEESARLLEEHQPDGKWPLESAEKDQEAARDIACELGGFTLAVESVAVYLGLHPEIRPADYLERLRAEGLPGIDHLLSDMDVAVQMLHREKQLSVVLEQTLARLSSVEQQALDFAALLPADFVPWPWLQALMRRKNPDHFKSNTGYADPWLALRRRLEGLRVLTPGSHPEQARLHRLLGGCIQRRLSHGRRDDLMEALVDLICEVQTPFAYELPVSTFLAAWYLIGDSKPLACRLMKNVSRDGAQNVSLAARWTNLAYQLGNTELEGCWLDLWEKLEGSSSEIVRRRAAFLHRKGDSRNACDILRRHLKAQPDDFEVSSSLLMYLAQTGQHHESEEVGNHLACTHSEMLAADSNFKAAFLHHRYFVWHELDRNDDAVMACRFVHDTYVEKRPGYDALIAKVNLGDALWGIGKVDPACDLLRTAFREGHGSGFAHVENIAAVCLANVLSSIGQHDEATRFYIQGVELSERIQHQWDLLYARAYQLLQDVELGRCLAHDLSLVREQARDAGFSYIVALAEAHVCIASFNGIVDPKFLNNCIESGLGSAFPAARLYACSARLRADVIAAGDTNRACVATWLSALEAVQGIKGRMGVIWCIADWLTAQGILTPDQIARLRRWTDRYLPLSLIEFYNLTYSLRK